MAKKLLYLFVVVNFIALVVSIVDGEGRSYESFISVWSGISVLAICESIEKSI